MTCIRQKRARSVARGVEHRLQPLPPRQESTAEHIWEEQGMYLRKRLSLSITAALMVGVATWPAVSGAVLYIEPVTGVADNDEPGGTGGYNPGYDIADEDGTLHYRFADGDRIEVEDVGRDVHAVSIASGNPPVALDVADGGTLDLSAIRGQTGTWGLAVGILNDGNSVTVNGDTKIFARADDEVQPVSSGSGAHAVIVRGGGSVVFNGATDFHARSPGYARAVWTSERSSIVFNGPTNILAESRGTLDAVYNSDLSSITFNGDTTIAARGIWPSDNSHAIYNDGVNSRLTVNGNLALTTVSQGSTAFGVRNQGIMEVNGDTTVNVEGPRSSHGIANTHRLARMIWRGDVDVRVRGGSYVPFGNPSGISNVRTPGAYMRYEGAVNVDVASAAETDGIISSGTIEFTSPTAPVSLTVASSCDGCNVYAIHNFGLLSVAGGLTVNASATGSGGAYSIWSLAGTQDAVVSVNQAGGQRVQLTGDVVTATDPDNGFRGAAEINLDTADSYLRGLVSGWTGASTGQAVLAFSNGATWTPQGTGTLSNDFGSGSLTLGNAGSIDMAGYWGSFAPSSIPTHAYRTLLIDSSNSSGASVSLGDGARFQLLSDITGINGTASADKIVFGSGITSFSATGTQGVSIVYDPVLDDSSWVNAATLRSGTTIQAAKPIEIVDASAAAGGSATFAAATGLDGEWSGTYENDLVQFTYTPQVGLSADGKKIVLSGISIQGSESGTSAGSGGSSSGSGIDTVTDTDTVSGSDSGSGTGTVAGVASIRPSETVLSAADAADSMVNLWHASGQASVQQLRNRARQQGTDRASVWVEGDSGELSADTAHARDYRQNYGGLTVGADRGFARDASSGTIGFTVGQVRSTANYEQGKGELTGTTLGLYSGWVADSGPYLLLGADASLLENRYSARDSENREIVGKYRTQAARTYAESGYPIKLGNGYYLEPQLGLSVGVIRGSRHTTRNGVQIDQDRQVSSVVRTGVELGKTLQGAGINGGLYVRASALRYQGDELDINASKDGGSIAADTADRNGIEHEFVLGGDIGFGPTNLFLEASEASGVDTKRNWAVQAGLRHSW